jgi:hypothetical protein
MITMNTFDAAAATCPIKKIESNFERQTDCDHGPPDQDCPGKSEDADDHEECTTTFAGKSDNVKDTDYT